MKKIAIIVFLIFYVHTLLCGDDESAKNKITKLQIYKNLNLEFYNIHSASRMELQTKKSPFLAGCLSFLLPGMGELYSNRFDAGKYSFIAEVGLWITFFTIDNYGARVRDDGRAFARLHAGFNPINKNDDYYVNVGNYSNIYEYNEKKLRDRALNKVYSTQSDLYWNWDSDDNRLKFRDMRVRSDEIINNLKYISIALIANRVISAINAVSIVNKYNKSLGQEFGYDLSCGVVQHQKKCDGFVVNLTKFF